MSEKPDAIILFCDGSSVPNPGFCGWGLHGYTYKNEKSKKGSGNADYYITDQGYVLKFMIDAERKGEDPFEKFETNHFKNGTMSILEDHLTANEVTPLHYLDFFGPLGWGTNNAGEVSGLLNALEYCLAEDIRIIQIRTDSEYALDGWNKTLPIWARNQWRRRDGEFIKNMELWKRLWELKQAMKDFQIDASWVQGHSVFYGNELADINANLGKNMSVQNLTTPIKQVSPASGYWKGAEVDKHPLITHQKLFFNNKHPATEPNTYYMAGVDKDLGMLGKRSSDTSYSVVQTKEPIESIDSLINHHRKMDNGLNDRLVVAHLSNFFKSSVYKQFMEYGHFSLYHVSNYTNDLSASDKQLVTEVIDPPKMSIDAVIAVNNLGDWMKSWVNKTPHSKQFVETDITDHLYESSVIVKKNKEITVSKLKASIQPGVASIEVDANYQDSNGIPVVLPTILSFGIDLADRNGLKRIEEMSPKVTLLTWEESAGVFRYFTVVQTNDDIGAYCGFYSNIRLNKLAKKKAK